MKEYPSILYFGDYWDLPIIAFDKIDGSNLRFEYSRKRGFYKFGTRHQMIDRSHPTFGFAIDIFLNKYEKDLTAIFKSKKYCNAESFVCYCELIGEQSSFGQHNFETDETFDVVLIDIEQYKKGFLLPKQFVDDFGHLHIPNIVYEGKLTKQFVELVKLNQVEDWEGKLTEGVVCKGKLEKGFNPIFRCKIKTNDWFERLRNLSLERYSAEIKELK